MSRARVGLFGLLTVIVIGVLTYLASQGTMSILAPAGPIADQERSLMYFATALSLIVVLPVFALTIFIVWRYRAGNPRATYKPDWDGNRVAETLWWIIPSALIAVLAVTAWRTSHSLDPTQAISSNQRAVEVQVVALQWKWLFIYPEYNVATVNKLEIPTGRPVHFAITADAPMNSFWIPELGGQIYAMPGMSTQLNLQADKVGNYRGSSANISGSGFAAMHFMAHADTPAHFANWIQTTQKADQSLTSTQYTTLAQPATAGTMEFGNVNHDLYNQIVNKYMGHHHMEGTTE